MLNIFGRPTGSIKNDLLSGMTVALALVPEAIAFAFVAGVSPLIGLYSAFFLGLVTAVIGGRPGMISGATGAMAVVVVVLVAEHGVEYLFPTVILCGLMQIAIGIGRLGKLIRMVPHSVMLGFVNGLAIVIGLAQLASFKTLSATGELVFLSGWPLLVMLVLVAATTAIIRWLPRVTKAVPASLVAILAVTLASVAINRSAVTQDGKHLLATVGDMLQTNTQAAAIAKANGVNRGHSPMHVGSNLLNPVVRSQNAPLLATGVDSIKLPAGSPSESVVADSTMAVQAQTGISGGLPVPFFMQYAMVPLAARQSWRLGGSQSIRGPAVSRGHRSTGLGGSSRVRL